MSIKLRDYQERIASEGVEILNKYNMLYLALQVRCGKTLTSLEICNRLDAKNVLFITKKKVIDGIYKDYEALGCKFNFTCINYESLHKLDVTNWNIIITDESHCMGAFPKPSKRTKQLKEIISKVRCNVILLSGTPTPESYSQMYHQLYVHPDNPFKKYSNFYRWANDYVKVKAKYIGSMRVNDYSGGIKDKIMNDVKHLMITFTQEEAGFTSKIDEHIIKVALKDKTYELCNTLKKDLVIKGKNDVVIADTGAKLMNKLHQMYSGTIITDSGARIVLDDTKAWAIYHRFPTERIGIFYKFKAELDALKQVFEDELVETLDEFNAGARVIALQIVSAREGISLRQADALVYYNIDFSAVSYFQSKDRMSYLDRKENNVYWVFSHKGIEEKIYNVVKEKRDYTLQYFKKDFLNS